MTFIYIIIIVGIAFFAYGREKTWVLFLGKADMGAVNFETFTPSKKPNHALFCPEGYCENATKNNVSPIFEMSTNALKEKLFAIIEAEDNIDKVASDDEKLEYRFVQYTPLMRYPDTIRVKLIGLDDEKSTLAIFSESQIGRSDLGVNSKRINKWLKC